MVTELVLGFGRKRSKDANTVPDDSERTQLSAWRGCNPRNSLFHPMEEWAGGRGEEGHFMRTLSTRLPHASGA